MYNKYGAMNNDTINSNEMAITLEDLSGKLMKISLLGNELDSINQSINVTGPSQTKADLLSKKEKEAIKLIEKTNVIFTSLAGRPISDYACKIQAEKLRGDFQRILHRFQRTQAEIKKRLIRETHQNQSFVTNLVDIDSDAASGLKTNSDVPVQGQMLSAINADVQELGQVLNQEDQMRSLEEDIVNVNIVFQQLSDLVYEQRATVDTIEANIESAYVNQQSGHSELVKAANSRRRSRKCWCILISVLAVIIVIVILILIIRYSSK